MIEKIIEGKVNKILADDCLLMQGFVKDDKQTVENVIKGMIAKLGENIKVGKFSRIQLGEV